jgi:hypothetical protein
LPAFYVKRQCGFKFVSQNLDLPNDSCDFPWLESAELQDIQPLPCDGPKRKTDKLMSILLLAYSSHKPPRVAVPVLWFLFWLCYLMDIFGPRFSFRTYTEPRCVKPFLCVSAPFQDPTYVELPGTALRIKSYCVFSDRRLLLSCPHH